MEKININLKLAADFFKKYAIEYILLMLKPIGAGILGALIFGFSMLAYKFSINYAFLSLLSLPLFFYSFWRGFLVTYALNFSAYGFYKKNEITLKDALKLALEQGNKLAVWITFLTVVLLFFLILIMSLSILSSVFVKSVNPGVFASSIVIFIFTLVFFIIPLTNFQTQAFFYKREDEGYFKLLLNCYKVPGVQGFVVALCMTILPNMLCSMIPLGSLFIFVLNPFVFVFNNFYYFEKLEIKF